MDTSVDRPAAASPELDLPGMKISLHSLRQASHARAFEVHSQLQALVSRAQAAAASVGAPRTMQCKDEAEWKELQAMTGVEVECGPAKQADQLTTEVTPALLAAHLASLDEALAESKVRRDARNKELRSIASRMRRMQRKSSRRLASPAAGAAAVPGESTAAEEIVEAASSETTIGRHSALSRRLHSFKDLLAAQESRSQPQPRPASSPAPQSGGVSPSSKRTSQLPQSPAQSAQLTTLHTWFRHDLPEASSPKRTPQGAAASSWATFSPGGVLEEEPSDASVTDSDVSSTSSVESEGAVEARIRSQAEHAAAARALLAGSGKALSTSTSKVRGVVQRLQAAVAKQAVEISRAKDSETVALLRQEVQEMRSSLRTKTIQVEAMSAEREKLREALLEAEARQSAADMAASRASRRLEEAEERLDSSLQQVVELRTKLGAAHASETVFRHRQVRADRTRREILEELQAADLRVAHLDSELSKTRQRVADSEQAAEQAATEAGKARAEAQLTAQEMNIHKLTADLKFDELHRRIGSLYEALQGRQERLARLLHSATGQALVQHGGMEPAHAAKAFPLDDARAMVKEMDLDAEPTQRELARAEAAADEERRFEVPAADEQGSLTSAVRKALTFSQARVHRDKWVIQLLEQYRDKVSALTAEVLSQRKATQQVEWERDAATAEASTMKERLHMLSSAAMASLSPEERVEALKVDPAQLRARAAAQRSAATAQEQLARVQELLRRVQMDAQWAAAQAQAEQLKAMAEADEATGLAAECSERLALAQQELQEERSLHSNLQERFLALERKAGIDEARLVSLARRAASMGIDVSFLMRQYDLTERDLGSHASKRRSRQKAIQAKAGMSAPSQAHDEGLTSPPAPAARYDSRPDTEHVQGPSGAALSVPTTKEGAHGPRVEQRAAPLTTDGVSLPAASSLSLVQGQSVESGGDSCASPVHQVVEVHCTASTAAVEGPETSVVRPLEPVEGKPAQVDYDGDSSRCSSPRQQGAERAQSEVEAASPKRRSRRTRKRRTPKGQAATGSVAPTADCATQWSPRDVTAKVTTQESDHMPPTPDRTPPSNAHPASSARARHEETEPVSTVVQRRSSAQPAAASIVPPAVSDSVQLQLQQCRKELADCRMENARLRSAAWDLRDALEEQSGGHLAPPQEAREITQSWRLPGRVLAAAGPPSLNRGGRSRSVSMRRHPRRGQDQGLAARPYIPPQTASVAVGTDSAYDEQRALGQGGSLSALPGHLTGTLPETHATSTGQCEETLLHSLGAPETPQKHRTSQGDPAVASPDQIEDGAAVPPAPVTPQRRVHFPPARGQETGSPWSDESGACPDAFPEALWEPASPSRPQSTPVPRDVLAQRRALAIRVKQLEGRVAHLTQQLRERPVPEQGERLAVRNQSRADAAARGDGESLSGAESPPAWERSPGSRPPSAPASASRGSPGPLAEHSMPESTETPVFRPNPRGTLAGDSSSVGSLSGPQPPTLTPRVGQGGLDPTSSPCNVLTPMQQRSPWGGLPLRPTSGAAAGRDLAHSHAAADRPGQGGVQLLGPGFRATPSTKAAVNAAWEQAKDKLHGRSSLHALLKGILSDMLRAASGDSTLLASMVTCSSDAALQPALPAVHAQLEHPHSGLLCRVYLSPLLRLEIACSFVDSADHPVAQLIHADSASFVGTAEASSFRGDARAEAVEQSHVARAHSAPDGGRGVAGAAESNLKPSAQVSTPAMRSASKSQTVEVASLPPSQRGIAMARQRQAAASLESDLVVQGVPVRSPLHEGQQHPDNPSAPPLSSTQELHTSMRGSSSSHSRRLPPVRVRRPPARSSGSEHHRRFTGSAEVPGRPVFLQATEVGSSVAEQGADMPDVGSIGHDQQPAQSGPSARELVQSIMRVGLPPPRTVSDALSRATPEQTAPPSTLLSEAGVI